MKKLLLLLVITSYALPALAQSTSVPAPSEAGLAGMLLLVGQLLLVVVAVLVALAWIWFPFMVKARLDKIIRRLDKIEQLQTQQRSGPPPSS